MVPRCYLREGSPSTENHDLPSVPQSTLPNNPPPSPPIFSHISLSRLALLCLPLRSSTPPLMFVAPRGGVTIEKQLAERAGNWPPDQDQTFMTKTLWNARYPGRARAEKTSFCARAARTESNAPQMFTSPRPAKLRLGHGV